MAPGLTGVERAGNGDDIFWGALDTAGHIPANTTIKISDPITLQFGEAVKSGFPRPQVPQLDNFWGNFDNALALVIQKGSDPQKAAADACAAMNKANKIP